MKHPDDYPLPAADLLNHRFYRRKKRTAMVIVASRGCPMTCSYCSVGARAGSQLSQKKRCSVVREIQRGVDQYNVGFIDLRMRTCLWIAGGF